MHFDLINTSSNPASTRPFLGTSLLKKLVVAIPACLDHRAALAGFEKNLEKEAPEVFAEWVKMYEAWDELEDRAIDCPFVAPRQGKSLPLLYS